MKDAEQGVLAMIIWRMNEGARNLSPGCIGSGKAKHGVGTYRRRLSALNRSAVR